MLNTKYKHTKIQLVVRDTMNSICPMNFFRTTDTIWKPGYRKTTSNDLGILANILLRMMILCFFILLPLSGNDLWKAHTRPILSIKTGNLTWEHGKESFGFPSNSKRKANSKAVWDASSEQFYIVNCSFPVCLPTFNTHPQLNHWTVTKGSLHFSIQCFYVLGAIN